MPGDVSLAHHGILYQDERPSSTATSLRSYGSRFEDGVVPMARMFVAGYMLIPYPLF